MRRSQYATTYIPQPPPLRPPTLPDRVTRRESNAIVDGDVGVDIDVNSNNHMQEPGLSPWDTTSGNAYSGLRTQGPRPKVSTKVPYLRTLPADSSLLQPRQPRSWSYSLLLLHWQGCCSN